MKKDLIWGIVDIAMALLMLFCVVFNIVCANWAAMPICVFALILNVVNAVVRFKDYARHKRFMKEAKEQFPYSSFGFISD